MKKDQKIAGTKFFFNPKISYVISVNHAKEFLKYVLYFHTFLHIPFIFSYKLVIVGGGAGGCSTAAKFASKYPGQVAVIEPRDVLQFRNNTYKKVK